MVLYNHMASKKTVSIDALFGSKTRVKLMRLFMSNPDKAFYVREITRLIDEQINSVRRELSNMMNAGVITSDNSDNKLYYKANKRYKFHEPFKAIFTDKVTPALNGRSKEKVKDEAPLDNLSDNSSQWRKLIADANGLHLAIASGRLVSDSSNRLDLLLVVDDTRPVSVNKLVSKIEKLIDNDLNYSSLGYNEFRYRLSVKDRFLGEVLNAKHEVVKDINGAIDSKKKGK